MLFDFLKQNKVHEYYFGLFLKEDRGIGYILKKNNGSIEIVSKEPFMYSNSWEHLIEDVDEVLFKLEKNLKTQMKEVIFFVFSHLVEETTKEIKKPYLTHIKNLSKNLELKPIGYIECYEAVVGYLEKKEQSPLTAILIELDSTNLDVFIYKGGHKVLHSSAARTNEIVEDLLVAFKKIGSGILLPSRIVLYNSSHLIEESTKIVSHKWDSELFVQIPRVEILKEEETSRALSELFKEQICKTEPEPSFEEHKEEMPSEVLGFVIGKDIEELEPKEEYENKEQPSVEKKPLFKPSFSFKIPQFRIPKIQAKLPLFVAGGVLVVIMLLFATEFFFHKADITIGFSSQKIKESIALQASLDESSTDDLLRIKTATSSLELTEKKVTTGKKDVGEKAKGEVTLYNFDDKDKQFAKGTSIQSGSVSFDLNEDIKVAAATLASDASAKLPGKTKVGVTAVEIGPEGNMDKGSRFKIGDLSQSVYFAMNEVAFSGGTKKTLRTVSKKDMDDLENSLIEKAKKSELDKMKQTNEGETKAIDSLTEFKLTNKKFSKELGEEGDEVSLKANVLAYFHFFEDRQMKQMLSNDLVSKVKTGYKLPLDNIKYVLTSVKKTDDSVSLKIDIDAAAVKSLDISEALVRITGKDTASIDAYIKDELKADEYEYVFSPSVIFFNAHAPYVKQNIKLHIESK